ncbi:MAG: SpaA isopeptide-forming pilin-related protein, partial [Tissierellia bacterium]|nr:SpaA isopeptide-forming pilin-related protein [Tissierellia bacterium]
MRRRRTSMLLMALLLILNTLPSTTFMSFAQENNSVQTTIKAKLSVEHELQGKQFKFELYDGENNLVKTVEKTGGGEIDFGQFSFEKPGDYKYTIKQVDLNDTNVGYDLAEKHITITLSEKDFKPVKTEIKYYGTAPVGEHITIGEAIGGADFQVYCIDEHKTLPPDTPTKKEYVAKINPTNDELAKMVTNNLWGDELSTVLKKIFFYFQAYPGKYSVDNQKQIVWAATGAWGSTQEGLGQWDEHVFNILKVTLPDEYNLVVFHPVIEKIEGTERYYQDLAMGYGAVIASSNEAGEFTVEIPEFNNKYMEPIQPIPEDTFYVSFRKVDNENNNLSGAILELSGEGKSLQWTSKNSNMVLTLQAGQYTLSEVSAPVGYQKAKDIKFKVDENGAVSLIGDDGVEIPVSEEIAYESYTSEDYGKEMEGHFVDNIYIKPIGASEGDRQVAYCLNHDLRPPVMAPDNLKQASFTKLEEKYLRALAPQSKVKDNDVLVGLVKEVIWKGYPNNMTNLQGSLSNEDFRALTQAAIWLFTDNITQDVFYQEIPYLSDMSPDMQAVYNELINVGSAIVPEDFILNVYESSNDEVQNVIGTSHIKGGSTIPEIIMVDEKEEAPAEVEVIFSKVEVNGSEELEDAKLKLVKLEDGMETLVEDWVSTKDQKKIKLSPGIYTMIETQAPEGFEIAESITFRITSDNKIEIKQDDESWQTVDNSTIKMEDERKAEEKLSISFHKVASDKLGVELEGAQLSIVPNDESLDSITFVSGENAKVIELGVGEYELQEIVAPHLYKKAANIEFKIVNQDENLILLVKEGDSFVEVKENEITMVDERYPDAFKGELKTTVRIDDKEASADRELILSHDEIKSEVEVVDLIAYEGLVPGQKYSVSTKLMKVNEDESTTIFISEQISEQVASESGQGEWTIDLGMVKLNEGEKYVIFEKATSVSSIEYVEDDQVVNKQHIVSHEDKNDKAQTIIVSKAPEKTQVKISKVDLAGKEIAGAKIEIRQ